MTHVSFRWPDELVARIDRARGDVPRSRWVQRAVERALQDRVDDLREHHAYAHLESERRPSRAEAFRQATQRGKR